MTKLLFIFLVLISTSAQSKLNYTEQEDLLLAKLSTTREIINKESMEWDNKFYDSLINDDDPNIQILGYKEKLNPIKSKGKSIDYTNIANSINDLLNYDSLSPKTLSNIEELCTYSQLEPHCHHELIFEKQLEATPKNAFIYLNALHKANRNHDFEEVERFLNDMANSKYIDIYSYPDPGYREKLESYVKDNPFQKNRLEYEKLSIVRGSKTTPEFNQAISERMNELMILTFVLGNRLSSSIPSYRDLVQTCKNNPKHEELCMKIAELFINHSKSIMSAQIGHAIKVEILKQHGDSNELVIAEKNKLNHKNNYECLSKIMHYGYKSYYINGPKYSVIAEPIERELGEVAFFKSLATLNYDFFSSLGNQEIMNPDQCNKNTAE